MINKTMLMPNSTAELLFYLDPAISGTQDDDELAGNEETMSLLVSPAMIDFRRCRR